MSCFALCSCVRPGKAVDAPVPLLPHQADHQLMYGLLEGVEQWLRLQEV